jgi:hypothetical protein
MNLVNKLTDVQAGDIVKICEKTSAGSEDDFMPSKVGYVKYLTTDKITLSDTDPFIANNSTDLRKYGRALRVFIGAGSQFIEDKIEAKVKLRKDTYKIKNLEYCKLLEKHYNNFK